MLRLHTMELGDRLQQTIGGVPTNYAVDINSALPQVLQDGTNSYVYGVGNLSQTNGSTTDYFLTDALGSTRQLVNANDQLALTENYDPFGKTVASMGSDSSIFDYAGQQTDPSGLQYLRARYYSSDTGQFLTQNSFSGYADMPQSENPYVYGLNNPVLRTDPSGRSSLHSASQTAQGSNSATQSSQGFGGGTPCLPWDQVLMGNGAEGVAAVTDAFAWLNANYPQDWSDLSNAWSGITTPPYTTPTPGYPDATATNPYATPTTTGTLTDTLTPTPSATPSATLSAAALTQIATANDPDYPLHLAQTITAPCAPDLSGTASCGEVGQQLYNVERQIPPIQPNPEDNDVGEMIKNVIDGISAFLTGL